MELRTLSSVQPTPAALCHLLRTERAVLGHKGRGGIYRPFPGLIGERYWPLTHISSSCITLKAQSKPKADWGSRAMSSDWLAKFSEFYCNWGLCLFKPKAAMRMPPPLGSSQILSGAFRMSQVIIFKDLGSFRKHFFQYGILCVHFSFSDDWRWHLASWEGCGAPGLTFYSGISRLGHKNTAKGRILQL